MKIPESQIEIKKIVGTSGHDTPVVYIVTRGGLHALFTKDEKGDTVSLGASPHRAITRWLGEQKDPKVKWNDDFIQKGEAFKDDLQKHEAHRFLRLRKAIFGPQTTTPGCDQDAFIIYCVDQKQFMVSDREELEKSIQAGEISRHDVIRHCSLTEPFYLAEDHPGFADLIRSRDGQ